MKRNLFDAVCGALPEYRIERLTMQNAWKYREIFFGNQEYYRLTDGRAPTEEDIKETIEYEAGPGEGTMLPIGFSVRDEPAAFLSLCDGYPGPETLYIGLLLVNDRMKRRRVGSRIVAGLIDAAHRLSYEEIRLSVLERNAAGRMFWESLGFGIAKAQKDGNLSMRYALARREESPRRSCKSLLMKSEKEAGEGI